MSLVLQTALQKLANWLLSASSLPAKCEISPIPQIALRNAEYLQFCKLFYSNGKIAFFLAASAKCKISPIFADCGATPVLTPPAKCRISPIPHIALHYAEYLQFRKLFYTKRQDSFLYCCFGEMQNISHFCRLLFIKNARNLFPCIISVLLFPAVHLHADLPA